MNIKKRRKLFVSAMISLAAFSTVILQKADIAKATTISVTGNIDPKITFALSSTTLVFGTLSAGVTKCASVSAGGVTCPPAPANTTSFSVSTNAKNGVIITIQDTNNGLKGVAHTGNVITATAANSSATPRYYGYGIVTDAQTGFALDAGFNGTGGNQAIASTLKTFAESDRPIDTVNGYFVFGAHIVGTTAADTYNDTVTVICTGRY